MSHVLSLSVHLCRDHGQRVADRQKTRLMWLVEDMGAKKFRETVSSYIGHELKTGKHIKVCTYLHVLRSHQQPGLEQRVDLGAPLRLCVMLNTSSNDARGCLYM